MDGVAVELVDKFHYLGFRLDCHLVDNRHIELINGRYLRAARAVGKLMRDMRCVSPVSLKKFFVTLVFSQLYGAFLVDVNGVEFSKGVGVFFRTALGLPESFPTVVAMSFLEVKSLKFFTLEQRMNFFLKLKEKVGLPGYAALKLDRCVLFRLGVGLNSLFGNALVELGILRTLDYREHYSRIVEAMKSRLAAEHNADMLGAMGRMFWQEAFPGGFLPLGLKTTLGNLQGESARTLTLFLSDSLRWTALKAPTKPCDVCKAPFTAIHFFSCDRPSLTGGEKRTFFALIRAESWENVINFIFDVLTRWIENCDYFRVPFRLSVHEYVPFNLEGDLFRWSL
jgi:hypothetical protein